MRYVSCVRQNIFQKIFLFVLLCMRFGMVFFGANHVRRSLYVSIYILLIIVLSGAIILCIFTFSSFKKKGCDSTRISRRRSAFAAAVHFRYNNTT